MPTQRQLSPMSGGYTSTQSPRKHVEMIGQEIGADLTMIKGGKVLAGIGLTLHQCGTRGYVYIAHVVPGGPSALCDTVTTDEGMQRGKIMIMDILIAVDGITMKQGVDNIPWVREILSLEHEYAICLCLCA